MSEDDFYYLPEGFKWEPIQQTHLDSMKIGPKLINALGLPPQTKWFELRCAVNEIVTVKCCYYPEVSDDGDELVAIMSEYRVCEKESE